MFDEEYPMNFATYSGSWVDSTPSPPNVEVSNIIQISLNEDSTVGDLKKFLEELESLQVDDNFPLLGHLSLVYVENDCRIERIHCGECGYEDLLVSPLDHQCSFVQDENIE